ncbi:MAG TPA: hypothetical protein VFF76_07270 [Holophagaceae bacterium]|nr:hypothetical protein [Holophagaceae bacterium]
MKRPNGYWVASGALKGEEFRRVGGRKALASVWEANGSIHAEVNGATIQNCKFDSREQAKRVAESLVKA